MMMLMKMRTVMDYIKTVRLKAVVLQLLIVQECALTTDSTWW